jgi:hypothetical protein
MNKLFVSNTFGHIKEGRSGDNSGCTAASDLEATVSPGARCEIDFVPQMKKFAGNYTSKRKNNFRAKGSFFGLVV